MQMNGERQIPATRDQVWVALNDPAVLQASIPGCESVERIGEHELQAVARVKIGPMSARFSGKVTLSELDPPNGYTITGEGQGGAAGFAKGGAHVALQSMDHGTLLRFDVQAQVGGKMAQIGARLIDATAKSLADQFFDRFAGHFADADAPQAELSTAPVRASPWRRLLTRIGGWLARRR
ncbi:SRPBCC family protein [Sphingomonas oligophenolica]|uniref:Carbon monoxide dehydrogenase n=1 Tax=Sphingomonas oligophenolica TaxID=301154 RepID=A0A502C9N9_9SPHN|nr:carbon monoxide dehydrogenase subunit G [Sphingomonas oligophenolica]TPG08456.1 carbon monoxide dehydrogenase [Sphingomonas oligophenolica]